MAYPPDPLRQKFVHDDYSYKYDFTYESNENVKYLTNSVGEVTKYIAVFSGGDIRIHNRNTGERLWIASLGNENEIVDVAYLPTEHKVFGIMVGLNGTSADVHNTVALLQSKGLADYELRLVRKIVIDYKITCVSVLLCDDMMRNKKTLLHQKMQSWKHVFVVGTDYGHCYLAQFGSDRIIGPDSDTPLVLKMTDALKPYSTGDKFEYSYDNIMGLRKITYHDKSTVHVSAIGFLMRSRQLIIGLSFGGIVTVSLTQNPTMSALQYPLSAAVRYFAPMEPDDDPRCHQFMWAAYDSSDRKCISMCLFEIAYPDEEVLDFSARTFDNPSIQSRLLHSLHNGRRWISMRSCVRERDENKDADETESSGNQSKAVSDRDSSIMFFSYIADDVNGSRMMGGVFDLNQYYYKRLATKISVDGSLARQCPFLSIIFSDRAQMEGENTRNIKDIVVDPSLITRFGSNISDADQLFYPSTLVFSRVYVAGSIGCYKMTLPSVQQQLLSNLRQNLVDHLDNACCAEEWIRALGLVGNQEDTVVIETGVSSQPEIASFGILMRVMIAYGHVDSVVKFIRKTENSKLKASVGRWVGEELQKVKSKLDETIKPLFDRNSCTLAPAARKSFNHSWTTFEAAERIFECLAECSSDEADKDAASKWKSRRMAAEALKNYCQLIHNLLICSFLPIETHSRESLHKLQRKVTQRRQAAEAKGERLWIDAILENIHKSCPNEPFWLGQTVQQWYPPALYNMIAPVLRIELSSKLKRQFLIYSALDMFENKMDFGGEKLIDEVVMLCENVLGINKETIKQIYHIWVSDKYNNAPANAAAKGVDENEIEVTRLMNVPRKLTYEEEVHLKALLNIVPLGEVKWQCYLIRNRRYSEVKEVEIPRQFKDDPIVLRYKQIMPAVNKIHQQLGNGDESVPRLPENIKAAIARFEAHRPNEATPLRLNQRQSIAMGKTPLVVRGGIESKLTNRKRSLAVQSLVEESVVATLETPPPAKKNLLEIEDDDSVISPVRISALSNDIMMDVLRTPKSRAVAAAEAEKLQLSICTTPENDAKLPPPSSILKSAAKRGEMSPARMKLRFALPDLSSNTPTNFENSAMENLSDAGGSIAAPIFDDDGDFTMPTELEEPEEISADPTVEAQEEMKDDVEEEDDDEEQEEVVEKEETPEKNMDEGDNKENNEDLVEQQVEDEEEHKEEEVKKTDAVEEESNESERSMETEEIKQEGNETYCISRKDVKEENENIEIQTEEDVEEYERSFTLPNEEKKEFHSEETQKQDEKEDELHKGDMEEIQEKEDVILEDKQKEEYRMNTSCPVKNDPKIFTPEKIQRVSSLQRMSRSPEKKKSPEKEIIAPPSREEIESSANSSPRKKSKSPVKHGTQIEKGDIRINEEELVPASEPIAAPPTSVNQSTQSTPRRRGSRDVSATPTRQSSRLRNMSEPPSGMKTFEHVDAAGDANVLTATRKSPARHTKKSSESDRRGEDEDDEKMEASGSKSAPRAKRTRAASSNEKNVASSSSDNAEEDSGQAMFRNIMERHKNSSRVLQVGRKRTVSDTETVVQKKSKPSAIAAKRSTVASIPEESEDNTPARSRLRASTRQVEPKVDEVLQSPSRRRSTSRQTSTVSNQSQQSATLTNSEIPPIPSSPSRRQAPRPAGISESSLSRRTTRRESSEDSLVEVSASPSRRTTRNKLEENVVQAPKSAAREVGLPPVPAPRRRVTTSIESAETPALDTPSSAGRSRKKSGSVEPAIKAPRSNRKAPEAVVERIDEDEEEDVTTRPTPTRSSTRLRK